MAEPPKASPQPPDPDVGGPPKHDTRDDLRAVVDEHKKAKARRPWWITALATALVGSGGAGAGGMLMGDDGKAKAAKAEQKLDDHITVEREVRRETREHLEQHDKALRHEGRKLDRMELLIELELDQHHVPQAKRPKREEGPEEE